MEKSRGTTSTVWSGWKWVKKMRSTANGSRPAWIMPRTAPAPRSKTSISPPVSTATQLCLLSRRGTTVPEPTTVTSILRLSFPALERPGEPGDAEEGAADHVRGPVHPEVDPARGHQRENRQDSHPPEPARPEDEDGPEQDDRPEHVSAGVWIRIVHLQDRRRIRRASRLLRYRRLRQPQLHRELQQPRNHKRR